MRTILAIALISLCVSNTFAATCPRVKCSSDKPSTNTGKCADITVENGNNYININKCADGYSCASSSLLFTQDVDLNTYKDNTYNCSAASVNLGTSTNLVHDEPCTQASQCASGTCTSSKCVGEASGAACTNMYGCRNGYYCLNSVCTAQKDADAACTTDYECKNDHGCHNSKCTKYGSLDNGVEVNLTSGYTFCKSYFARISGTKANCDEVSLKSNQCKNDSADNYCHYTLETSNADYKGPMCSCVWNESQEKYCPSDLANKAVIEEDDHTMRRFRTSYTWNTKTDGCVQEALYGNKSWYEKAWQSAYEGLHGVADWFKDLFGNSSTSTLTASYVLTGFLALLF